MEWIQEGTSSGGITPNALCAFHVCPGVGPGVCVGNICLTKGFCKIRNY